MKHIKTIKSLNKYFPMIGLSADWIFQTWLINGTIENGIVIFENEDDLSYEIVEFHYEDEERLERMIFSGSLGDVENYIYNTLNISFRPTNKNHH